MPIRVESGLRSIGLHSAARADSYARPWEGEVAGSGGKVPWMFILRCYQRRAKSVRIALGTLLSAILLAAACAQNPSPKKGRPLSHSEVARDWLGVSEGELCLLRISLNEQGQGVGAYSFLDEEPHLFIVPRWEYNLPEISIVVEPSPSDTAHWNINALRGSVRGVAMQLVMSGEGWSRSFSLRREEEWLMRLNRIKQAMEARAVD